MVNTFGQLDTAPVLQNTVLRGIAKASAFQRAATQVPLDQGGSALTELGRVNATWVTEGTLKPAKDVPLTKFEIVGRKLAITSVFTDELQRGYPAIAAGIQAETITPLARTFDLTVAGRIAAPAGFSTFTGADEIEVTNHRDLTLALAPREGYATSAIVLNLNALYRFRAVTNQIGAQTFAITGDDSAGTINGLPYFVFDDEGTDEGLAIVGPWASNAFWGVVAGSTNVKVLTEAAEIPDVANPGKTITVALKQRNLVGLLAETTIGFKVAKASRFRKLVIPDPA